MQLCIFMGMDSLCAMHSQQKNRSISLSFEYCVTIQNEKWEERKNVYEYRPHVTMEINAPADSVQPSRHCVHNKCMHASYNFTIKIRTFSTTIPVFIRIDAVCHMNRGRGGEREGEI